MNNQNEVVDTDSDIIQECEMQETFNDLQDTDATKRKDCKYVCFTRSRNGNGQQNHFLGLYENVGVHNDLKSYKQIDTTSNGTSTPIFAFQDAGNNWSLRATVNPSCADWILDPSILITMNDEKKVCGSLLLSTFNDDVSEMWPDCVGEFYPTFAYRHGRLVFKHVNHQVYLFIMRTEDF